MTEFQMPNEVDGRVQVQPHTSQSIDWYAEGDTRIVETGGVEIMVRFVGRKGRRARIAISAPPGAVFHRSPK